MKWSAVLVGVVVSLMVGTAWGLEIRTPVALLAPGRSAVELTMAHTVATSDRFAAGGRPLTRLTNTTTFSRLVARTSRWGGIELTLDLPWLLSRTKKKSPAPPGSGSIINNNGGLGDISVAVAREWRFAAPKMRLYTGLEIKLPSGDAERGLGTGAWGGVWRFGAVAKTALGSPYALGYYAAHGEGESNGVAIDEGDTLYGALGFRSPSWQGFGLDGRLLYSRYMTPMVRESGGKAAVHQRYALPGFQVGFRYRANDRVTITLVHKVRYPERHLYTVGQTPLIADDGPRRYTGLRCRVSW